MPVVKANSYGHGLSLFSKALYDFDIQQVAVGLIEEGVHLRKNGWDRDIYLLGPFDRKAADGLKSFNIIPIVNGWPELEIAKSEKINKIHLKFDTGMNRLGFRIEEANRVFNESKHFNVSGVCSHLHSGDNEAKVFLQVEQFKKTISDFVARGSHQNHLFNTDGMFKFSERYDLPFGARPGLGIYGYSTVSNTATKRLMPVMKLISKVAHLKTVLPGEGVSYDSTWIAQQRSCIAIVPIGYADGIHRSLSNKGRVNIKDTSLPIVGRICMDYLMVDVTDVYHKIKVGDDVEIFGDQVQLSEMAKLSGTIVWELLTSVSERVPKILVE